jgi:ribosomal protein S18 acetylase RimI-like enzyme
MLRWIEETWRQERPAVSVEAAADDVGRGALLRQHGYALQEAVATQRAYALTAPIPFAVLPESFRFTTAADEATPDSFIAAVAAAFGNAAIGPDWYTSIASAPSFHPQWLVQVRSPEGSCAAFAKISIDVRNHAAEIDPVGTHPAYQRMGLARALLLESFRRLRLAGIQWAWIGSAPEPAPSNVLYDQLKPALRYDVVAWQKRFSTAA